jgi:hypothetical protein
VTAWPASVTGVTIAPGSEASMAWARSGAANRRARSRCLVMVLNASRGSLSTIASTAGAKGGPRWGAATNDNYEGGDDNYPRVVMVMRSRSEWKNLAGTGRNSCR